MFRKVQFRGSTKGTKKGAPLGCALGRKGSHRDGKAAKSGRTGKMGGGRLQKGAKWVQKGAKRGNKLVIKVRRVFSY